MLVLAVRQLVQSLLPRAHCLSLCSEARVGTPQHRV